MSVPRDHPSLDLFEGEPVRRLVAGTNLFHRDDQVRSAFLVREGTVALVRTLESGVELTLHVARPGEIVAAASLFAERYHCDALCRTDVAVVPVPRRSLLERLDRDGALAALAASAHEVQSLRSRVEVLRLRRLADRLDAYLTLHGSPSAGEWVRVADCIGVTPAALYRELARRRGR